MLPEHHTRERFTLYAEILSKRFQAGMLANLQEKPFWVLWKPEKDDRGTFHKRPYSPKNVATSIYKPRQWASLGSVLEAVATGTFAGIGIMLPAPYVLLDTDAKPNAPIYDKEAKKIVSPLALKILAQVPSYAELSPNNGLHIITEGIPTRGNFKTAELEMYTNWFSTVTTKHLPETPLEVTAQQGAIRGVRSMSFIRQYRKDVFQNTGGGVGVLLGSQSSTGGSKRRCVTRTFTGRHEPVRQRPPPRRLGTVDEASPLDRRQRDAE